MFMSPYGLPWSLITDRGPEKWFQQRASRTRQARPPSFRLFSFVLEGDLCQGSVS